MMRMILNKGLRFVTGAMVAALVAGCASGSGGDTADGRPAVVTSLFPLAAVLERLGGPAVSVRNLASPGVEPHDLELTSPQVDAILDAGLAVVMGKDFQPSVEKAAEQRDGRTVRVLDRVGSGTDPHVWLDPVLLAQVVRELTQAVAATVPAGRRDGVRSRGDAAVRDLEALDAEFRVGLRDCDRQVIVTAHDAFGYLAKRYDLRQEPIAGISPEQEPDPQRIADLADLVERTGVTTVFTEELVSPRVARTLAGEAGVRTAVLDPIESPVRGKGFAAYLAAMRANLRALRTALGCR